SEIFSKSFFISSCTSKFFRSFGISFKNFRFTNLPPCACMEIACEVIFYLRIFPLESQCNPHSLTVDSSHHHLPARGSSFGPTALVHGSHPILGYPKSCNLLYGTSWLFIYSQTCSLVQSASGLSFKI